ncbi:hypothetical protein PQI07_26370 [Methylobacterium sp. 092160098-2]|uniref:hypothetical protein n=1 Tax=Methylobacterium sp. 092160098-2 TaxID=3025129 RepID=UPI002381945A|nr:hypothetical protein [Methylobacterium sp. 092160098-2]MDE4914199.1 hypothetical protein [Methylobacterium sp. 092160098-2]
MSGPQLGDEPSARPPGSPAAAAPAGAVSPSPLFHFALQGILMLAAAKLPAATALLFPGLAPTGWLCLKAVLLTDVGAYGCFLLAVLKIWASSPEVAGDGAGDGA